MNCPTKQHISTLSCMANFLFCCVVPKELTNNVITGFNLLNIKLNKILNQLIECPLI